MTRENRGASKYPDKRSIITEIWRRYHEGLALNYSAMRNEDDSLRRRSTTLFGGWRNAIEAAGFTYDDVRVDTDMASYYGYVFENLLGELLHELQIEFERYAHSKYNPDFVLNNGVWIDAKLSEWTFANRDCDTLQSYEPNCRMLRIIYFRGRVKDTMITPKTRITHVDFLLKQLPTATRLKYAKRLEEMDSQLKVAGL